MNDCFLASHLDLYYNEDYCHRHDDGNWYLGKCCRNVVAGAMGAASFQGEK